MLYRVSWRVEIARVLARLGAPLAVTGPVSVRIVLNRVRIVFRIVFKKVLA